MIDASYNEAIDELGWKPKDVAAYFGVAERTIYRWQIKAPPYIVRCLEVEIENRKKNLHQRKAS